MLYTGISDFFKDQLILAENNSNNLFNSDGYECIV